ALDWPVVKGRYLVVRIAIFTKLLKHLIVHKAPGLIERRFGFPKRFSNGGPLAVSLGDLDVPPHQRNAHRFEFFAKGFVFFPSEWILHVFLSSCYRNAPRFTGFALVEIDAGSIMSPN